MQDLLIREDNSVDIDLLGRQMFIDDVLKIMESFSKKEKSACYAINGVWGSGKSYVLNQLSEQAGNVWGEDDYRYFIFRYNCWEYDYYEEPLISLITSMVQAIDKEIHLFDKETRTGVSKALKKIAVQLFRKGLDVVKDKTGIDANEIYDTIKGIDEEAKTAIDAELSFNAKLSLQNALSSLQEQIATLSKKRTVVFLVDELDRCLPEYAIRVLERLHHIFEGIGNVQVIFSIDRGQLEQVVKQIYGEDTKTKKYLKKFISFEIKLSLGKINEGFDVKFREYIQQFATCPTEDEKDMAAFKSYIFDGLDIRQRIALVEKAELVHDILFSGEKSSAYDLCVELFLVVLDECLKNPNNDNDDISKISRKIPAFRFPFPSHDCFIKLQSIYENNIASDGNPIHNYDSMTVSYNAGSLYGSILCAYFAVLGVTADGGSCASIVEKRAKQIWKQLTLLE